MKCNRGKCIKKILFGVLFGGLLLTLNTNTYVYADEELVSRDTNEDGVGITTVKFDINTPIEVAIENADGTEEFQWYVGADNHDTDGYDMEYVQILGCTESTYKPMANQYESWLKVVVTRGEEEVGSEAVYFSKLPVVYINTEENAPIVSKEEYIGADMFIQGNELFDEQYDGAIEIKGRGNSTWNGVPKKPYKIKLDKSTDLFGFGKNKHYVLLANYYDESLMKNMLSMDLSEYLGLIRMQSTWVDVILNGQYIGNYQLCEQIRVGEDRVDIYDWSEEISRVAEELVVHIEGYEDLTSKEKKALKKDLESFLEINTAWITSGTVKYKDKDYNLNDLGIKVSDNIKQGYLIELSEEFDEISEFMLDSGLRIMIKTPEYTGNNPEMMAYLIDLFQGFENAYKSVDGYNEKGVSYLDITDMDSLISFWLTNEIVGNRDAYKKSRYVYISEDGKITWGPAWDFDSAMGSEAHWVSKEPTGWQLSGVAASDPGVGNTSSRQALFNDIVDDPYFCFLAYEAYWANRDYFQGIVEKGGLIDKYDEYILEAGYQNELLWYYKKSVPGYSKTPRGYEGDREFCRDYLIKRLTWLDKQFESVDTLVNSLKSDVSTNTYNKDANAIVLKSQHTDKSEERPMEYAADLTSKITAILEGENVASFDVYVNGKKVTNVTTKYTADVPGWVLEDKEEDNPDDDERIELEEDKDKEEKEIPKFVWELDLSKIVEAEGKIMLSVIGRDEEGNVINTGYKTVNVASSLEKLGHKYDKENYTIDIEETKDNRGQVSVHCPVCDVIDEDTIVPFIKGWKIEDDKAYWYEKGIRQGVKYKTDGKIDETYRGKEIYDPYSNAWYWLDNINNGAKAVSKDVYQESRADDQGTIGKWVRYDEKGHMVKGWDISDNKFYYFDEVYGTMYKGKKVIDGVTYTFDKADGTLLSTDSAPGWKKVDKTYYWYENNDRQGVKYNKDGSLDLTYRGKEIYDPLTDGWYWLDCVQKGMVAKSKDVYQESLAGPWGDVIGDDGNRYGKWVRYGEDGRMIKGWQTDETGTYYFDKVYGTMAKGYCTIYGIEYYFNPVTGVLEKTIANVPKEGWKVGSDGKRYWYEDGNRQGYSINEEYRGKEIYDPESNAWYWLDNVQNGAVAVSKDVYQESLAGPWGETTDSEGNKIGKWVRYDKRGHMIKGWSKNINGTYYFDETYGTMAKGYVTIDGQDYHFDENTGVLISKVDSSSKPDESQKENLSLEPDDSKDDNSSSVSDESKDDNSSSVSDESKEDDSSLKSDDSKEDDE